MGLDLTGSALVAPARTTTAQHLSLVLGLLTVALAAAGFATHAVPGRGVGAPHRRVIGFALNPPRNGVHRSPCPLGLLACTSAGRARWYGTQD